MSEAALVVRMSARARASAVLARVSSTLLREAMRRRRVRKTGAIKRKLESAMRTAFDRQGKAFLRRFGALKPKFPEVQEAIRNEDWESLLEAAARATQRLFAQPIDEAARAALLAGALDEIASSGVVVDELSFDLANPRAVEYLREYGAQRVTLINETTRERLRALLERTVQRGYSATAKAIGEQFADFGRSRAKLIALVEVGEAYTAGNFIGAQELAGLGNEMEKSWLTAGDSKVTPECDANASAGWIPLDDAFPSGHLRPLRFPGCRCDVIFRVKGEK